MKTMHLRQVWRTENDGNGDIKVLVVQQWNEAAIGGYWEDLEISMRENNEPPNKD